MAEDIAIAADTRWFRSLSGEQWKVLIASNLGWLFDGFELYALILTVGFALHQLLDAAQYAQIPRYAGYILATTVLGWATGGIIGGIVADYIGRNRTMILAVLGYSLTTGLSAAAWNWESFAALRFLVGVVIGSEWTTGTSIVSELWPDDARGKGGGLLQCGNGIGGMLASGVWLLIGSAGPGAWRWMYLVGVLPALITFWIRLGIPESPRWEVANQRRQSAHALSRRGAILRGEDAALARFTIADLLTDRSVRRPLIVSLVMMLSVTFSYWGAATFIPTYVGSVAAKAGVSADADGLFVGAGHLRLAGLRRCLRFFRPGGMGVGNGLASRALSDPNARNCGCIQLQRAALPVLHRAADCRRPDRRPRRLWSGSDNHRAVFRDRFCSRTVSA